MLHRPLKCQYHWVHKQFGGFQDLPGWGSACESQDDGTKSLYAIVVCSMHVHCKGIRSSSHRPRHWITLILARQLWQSVSALAEIVIVFWLWGDRLVS